MKMLKLTLVTGKIWLTIQRALVWIVSAVSNYLIISLRTIVDHAKGGLNKIRQTRWLYFILLSESTVTISRATSLSETTRFDTRKSMFHCLAEIRHTKWLKSICLTKGFIFIVNLLFR